MTRRQTGSCNTTNKVVLAWVDQIIKQCQPNHVHWCDGSEEEKKALTAEAIAKGILIELDQKVARSP